ncbi:MAG TPA: metallopeptidase family protein [Oscillospiraceae bacterium]|nr:metallopeptidase family protein [Oscillospiraceae bacterium]
MLSFEAVGELLDELAERFPPEFFRDLNGGVSLLPDRVRNPREPGLFVLGEYRTGEMGRYIYLYYGSFAAAFGSAPDEVLREELQRTLAHELTHHVESLAGERGLEIKDAQFLEEYRRRKK